MRVPAAAPVVILHRSLDDPDAKLVELLLAASAARELGARRVVLVAPYLAYMRQDQAFRAGEAVSQRVIGGSSPAISTLCSPSIRTCTVFRA